jgi:hypothetical protein
VRERAAMQLAHWLRAGQRAMERIRRNIEDIRERLQTESHPRTRWALQRLLFRELYRIGFRRELIDVIDHEIAGWRDWISRQQALVDRLENSRRETEPARALLLLAQQTLAVHEIHRERMLTILALNTPSKRGSSSPDDGRNSLAKPESTGQRGTAPGDEDGV